MECMDKKCELGDTSEETSAVDNLVYPSSSLVDNSLVDNSLVDNSLVDNSLVDSSLVDSSIRVYYLAV
jgi:hypothetical protein